MVLFVFVIMLLNAGEEEHKGVSWIAYLLGIPGVFAVFGLLAYTLTRQGDQLISVELGHYLVKTQDVGMALFTQYLLPFEITSILILVAIMGAVVLARREH